MTPDAAWPRLRPATNADRESVRNLVFTVLVEYGLKPDPGCTDADLDDIEQSYLARGGVFYVLQEQDGAIVGSYDLYPTESGVCELRKMYLHRDYRGKGLGRRLLEDALAHARQSDFRRITLETASVLKEAIGLYESYGFKPCKIDHLSCRCDQAYALDPMNCDNPNRESRSRTACEE
ncbi:MAG TPA: GNAT family N-acetyltransferase [Sedimentisphaerales bacterium]|nr:GNAT family N-acetyltransferase [Sedimentisphaerales bacterium]